MGPFFQPELQRWAREQFALAGELCRGCRAYHATWGYRRLSGVVGGVEADAEALGELLRPLLGGDARTVLIAGSADSGLAALLHHWAGPAAAHRWWVVDRCETPLAACRAWAREQGLALQTLRADLRALPMQGVAELVVGHSILGFQDAAGRNALLRSLARALAPGGSLVLAARLAAEGQSVLVDSTLVARQTEQALRSAANTLAALAARNVTLPCAAPAFEALLREAATPEQHGSPYCDRAALEDELAAAGFDVRAWQPGGGGLAFLDDGQVRAAARPTWVLRAQVDDGRRVDG